MVTAAKALMSIRCLLTGNERKERKMFVFGKASALAAVFVAGMALSGCGEAQSKYGPGVTDKEIRLGTTMPFSGPVSSSSLVGKAMEAYYNKVNDEGGINGRKVRLIAYDDAYNPAKTVEQVRRLVESDEVLALVSPMGTAMNTAIRPYLNSRKVPQLFVVSGSPKFNDPKHYPWTMGWVPSNSSEGAIYGALVVKNKPNAKIAVLSQNDDFGRDFLNGFKAALGDKASQIAATEYYEVSDPTVDSRVVSLAASGADVFFDITQPKFAAQAIRKAAQLGWKPLQFLISPSSTLATVIEPAGFENAQGIISSDYTKSASDPTLKDDPGIKRFESYVAEYLPGVNKNDRFVMNGYCFAQTMVEVLKRADNDLTRENVMKQAELDCLLPGIFINTSSANFVAVSQFQLMRFEGDRWVRFGQVIDGT
jgi:branched-chain amino acid transport system substrate-binding protein